VGTVGRAGYSAGKAGRLIPLNSTEKEPTQPSNQQLLEKERKDLSYPPVILPRPIMPERRYPEVKYTAPKNPFSKK